MMNFARFFLMVLIVFPSMAFGALEMTYNGRLLQPDGDPEPTTQIYLRFDIKSVATVSGAQCYLFKQAQATTAVTTDLDGVFQILISGASSDKVFGPADLDTVFSANAARACHLENGTATGFSIGAGDSQILELKVYFRFDSSDGWDLIDTQTIRPTIEAVNAQKLAGLPASNYIQVDNSATQSAFSTFFNASDFGKVQNYAAGGDLDLGSQNITNVDTPTSDDMAANKGYADDFIAGKSAVALGTLGVGDADKLMVWSGTQWVVKSVTDSNALSRSGGTMSGAINMANFGINNLSAPAGTGSAVNKFYVDNVVANALPLTGGSISGALNMGGNDITNVGHIMMTNERIMKLGTYTADPGLAATYAGALWYDSTDDILKYRTSVSGTKPVSSLMALTVAAPLTYSLASNTGSLAISSATTATAGVVTLGISTDVSAGKVVQTNDSRLTDARATTGTTGGDLSGSYPSPTVAKIQGYAFVAGAPSNDHVPKFTASGWTPSFFGVENLRSPAGTAQMPFCTNAQTLSWDSTNKVYNCTSISITNSQISGLGSAATRNAGTLSTNLVELNSANQIPTVLLEKEVVRAGGNTLTAEMVIGTFDNNGMALYTSSTRRVTILDDGKVGIGNSSPSEALEVTGNIKASGTVQGATLVTTSDRRLKEDVRKLNGLELILKMQGHRFRWKTDGKEDIGFIAQEIEAVDPDLVVTNEQTGLKGVKYSNIAAPLVEATKEIYGLCQMAKAQSERLQRQWAEKFSRLEAAQAADRAAIKDMSQHMQKLELDNQRLRQDLEDMKQTLKRLAR